jgi:hypothetical protein
VIIRAVGSYATNGVRHCLRRIGRESESAGLPAHVAVLAIDTAPQVHLDGVELLPPHCFLNLGLMGQMQERLRRARELAHVAEYMPEPVTHVMGGEGAGGFPAAARYFYEQSLSAVVTRMAAALEPFTPARRPAMANIANGHPMLRAAGMEVTPTGPVRCVFTAGGTGGTGAISPQDAALQKEQMRRMGIEGHFILLLIPPATGSADPVEAARKRRNFFARVQELTDLNEGKELIWPLGDEVLSMRGPIFDAIYVLPEPVANQLQQGQRFLGHMLFELLGPLGVTFGTRAVDMVHVQTERGPHGQKKYLSLLGMATLEAAAYPDLAGYAAAKLRLAAVAEKPIKGGEQAVSTLLASNGLTATALAHPPALPDPGDMPPNLGDDSGPVLDYMEGKAREEARGKARDAAVAFGRQCEHALPQGIELLRKACRGAGPAAAARVGTALAMQIRTLEATAARAQARHARAVVEARSDDIRDRLQARCATQSVRAHAELAGSATGSLQKLASGIDRAVAALQGVVEEARELAIDGERRVEEFRLRHTPPHVVLDGPTIDALIRNAEPACSQEIRAMAARALDAPPPSAGRFRADAQAVIERVARVFDRLGIVDEALKAAGPAGRSALENVVVAAEPAVRTDAMAGTDQNAVRHVYLSAPESSPVAAVAQRSGRAVFHAADGVRARRVTLLTATYGVEPAALVATQEAFQAYVASPAEYPPYADQNYKPIADVMVPAPSELFAYLALAVSLHLGGPIRYDELDGYTYDGHPLGVDRVAASAALRERTGRLSFLPGFEELCAQTQEMLRAHAGRGARHLVTSLTEIEEKLEQHIRLVRPAEKQILMLERAAARVVRARYEEQIQRHAAHVAVWGPCTAASAMTPRCSPQANSVDGEAS